MRPWIEPTTMWGIPDALVVVDGYVAPAATEVEPRIDYGACRFEPRIAVASKRAVIASQVEQPVTLFIARAGDIPDLELASSSADKTPKTVQLPIAGHEVEFALEPHAVYAVTAQIDRDGLAWIVADPSVAITDAAGQVVVHGVSAGEHQVAAWIATTNDRRIARGKVTVVAGETAELTLQLGAPAPAEPPK